MNNNNEQFKYLEKKIEKSFNEDMKLSLISILHTQFVHDISHGKKYESEFPKAHRGNYDVVILTDKGSPLNINDYDTVDDFFNELTGDRYELYYSDKYENLIRNFINDVVFFEFLEELSEDEKQYLISLLGVTKEKDEYLEDWLSGYFNDFYCYNPIIEKLLNDIKKCNVKEFYDEEEKAISK